MESSLKNGTCNVLVSDTYRIGSSKTGLQNDIADGKYIFSDYFISRNFLSSVVRSGDGVWFDIVEGSRQAAHRGTQIGIRKGSGDSSQCTSNSTSNEISFYNVPRCVGNSMEIFLAHLGNTIVRYSDPGDEMLFGLLPAIDAPNFGSLACDDSLDVLKYGRLKTIKERGYIICAVFLDPSYNLTKSSLATLVNVEFCKMMSVAIFQGKSDAVKIEYIDEMDYSAFPREFDIVAGASWEATVSDSDINNFGKMMPCLPYFFHDKYRLNGTEYNGAGLALTYLLDNEDVALLQIANAIFTATVYAQRNLITRANHVRMPLIHLFGNSLTFMLRDVIMYAGNYDDIINEAVVASDGTTDKGWNMVIPNSNYAPKVPSFYCEYTGSCIQPCEYNPIGYNFICQHPAKA